MENCSVFDFKDFKEYLSVRFSTIGNSRGMRIKFAQQINASPSYVSKVLSGKIKLGLENVPILNNLLQHNEQEAEYFMLTVLYTQAGSKALEDYFGNQIELFIEKQRVTAPWVENAEELSEQVQAKYASQWIYAVIHIMTGIREYQTKSAIAERLKLSLPTVTNALETLVKMGLLERKDDRYRNTKNRVHLKKDSKWIHSYHQSFRQFAIQRLSEASPNDVHYSMVATLGLSEIELLKKKIQKLVSEFEPIIHAAKSEEAYLFSMDFFRA